MIKKRLVTITITILLLIAAFAINTLYNQGLIHRPVVFATIMFVSTAVHVFGGCMLQTFGHPKISLALGCIVFFILCICLFYSISIYDFFTFGICMALLIRRTSRSCECLDKCDNPLR